MAADTAQPPGRLRAAAGLDHQTITVPASLRALGLIYWSFCLITGLGGMLAIFFWDPAPEKLSLLLAVVIFVALLFFAWRVFGGLLHWSNRSWVGAVVSPLLLMGLFSLPVSLVFGVSLFGGAVAVVGVLFHWWMARWLAQPATLTIDQANLVVSHGSHTRSIPLEEIRAATRSGPWWRPRAQVGPAGIPILTGLSAREWAWLSTRILDEARRRRHQLAQSGHDLQQPAAPPAGLQRLRSYKAQ